MYNPPSPRFNKPLHKRRASKLTASHGKKTYTVRQKGDSPRSKPFCFKDVFPAKKRIKIYRAPKTNIKFMYGDFWKKTFRESHKMTIVLSWIALLEIMYFNAIATRTKLVPLYMFTGFPPIITLGLSTQLKSKTAQKVLAMSSLLCCIVYPCLLWCESHAENIRRQSVVYHTIQMPESLLRLSVYLLPVLLPCWIIALYLDKKRKDTR